MTDQTRDSRSFDLLHPQVQRWIWKKGWEDLRDIQEDAINAILGGDSDIIIAAATAGGKTEAAFLPLCSSLLTPGANAQGRFDQRSSRTEGHPERAAGWASEGFPQLRTQYDQDQQPSNSTPSNTAPSVQLLYISPLKALINDQWQRLDDLCEDLHIPVHRWHGDVSSSKKRKLLDNPSGILLITPESLEALFINQGPRLRSLFGGLRAVVVDELHAFIGTERGMQLQSQLHRLEVVIRRPLRRIALSATLGEMSLAAEFLHPGAGESVQLIASEASGQEVRLQIRGYVRSRVEDDEESGGRGSRRAAEEENPEEESSEKQSHITPELAIARHLFTTLRGSNNLVFANARSRVEEYADRLRRMCEIERLPQEFWPHHGSLSKELRTDVEAMIKSGSRPVTVICTSTLELGIDLGSVKSVAQIGCPPGVASMRQRLGRSGRRGEAAEMRIYITEDELDKSTHPVDQLRPDLIQAIAMVELLRERWYEPPDPARVHGSTLVQQLLSAVAQYGGLRADDAWKLLCETGPFHGLTQQMFINLLRELGRQDVLMQSSDATLLLGEKGEAIVGHYSFYAAFNSPEEYRVVADGKTLGTMPISGPLEEERLLIFAGRRWRIISVDEQTMTIIVKPAPGGLPPTWKGTGALVHDIVRKRMRKIYLSEDVPLYLDATARGLLEEGRKSFRELGLDHQNILTNGEESYVFPWAGDRQMSTLVLMLERHGLKAAADGVAVEIENRDVELIYQTLQKIAGEREVRPTDLVANVQNKHVEKWDWLLNEELLDVVCATRMIDVDGAHTSLRQQLLMPHAPAHHLPQTT